MTEDDHLAEGDLRALATCAQCHGVRVVPDIFGDPVLCHDCALMPSDPFE